MDQLKEQQYQGSFFLSISNIHSFVRYLLEATRLIIQTKIKIKLQCADFRTFQNYFDKNENNFLVPRTEGKQCDKENEIVSESLEVQGNDESHNEKQCNQEKIYCEKTSDCQIKSETLEKQKIISGDNSNRVLTKNGQLNTIRNSPITNKILRKDSLISECSTSTDIDTPRHISKFSSSIR